MSSVKELEALHEQELQNLAEEKAKEFEKIANSGAATKKKFENKWKEKLKEVEQRHETELWEAKMSSTVDDEEDEKESTPKQTISKDGEEKKKAEQRKLKNAKKKQKKVQKQTDARQQAHQEFMDSGGVTQRDVEIERIKQYLESNQSIFEIDSDGHCLYRSLADQLNTNLNNSFTKQLLERANSELSEKNKRELKSLTTSNGLFTYLHLRSLIANQLRRKSDEYFPFVMDVCETMDEYANIVESSSEWGGQVEIQAFLDLCGKQFILKIVQDSGIVLMGDNSMTPHPSSSILFVSYHKRYYALGEHYNSIKTI